MRPTVASVWNSGLKNGTDIYSQYLSQLSFAATKASRGSMALFRTRLTMIFNSLELHRLALGEKHIVDKSYALWKKKATRAITLKECCIQALLSMGVAGESKHTVNQADALKMP